jgi:hypothetical protein
MSAQYPEEDPRMNISRMLADGAILSIIASVYLLIVLYLNPRLFLQDYPEDIQRAVPPKTNEEKRLSLVFGLPFFIALVAVPFLSTINLKYQLGSEFSFCWAALNAIGILLVFNIVDWLILDWFVFCTLTPKFVVIPGTEGMSGYKNYKHHFRGFLIGTALSIMAGLILGAVSMLI